MPNMAYINDFPRLKYHLEYWKVGDSAYQVQNCEFHSAFIDEFHQKVLWSWQIHHPVSEMSFQWQSTY